MPDRLATQLLRIARDPATGWLHHPGPLAVGLRAALFTDLILTGRVSAPDRGPRADEPADSGDRILDAVQRTVAHRPDVAWWRWFRHVRADRVALLDELVTAQRWAPHAGPRPGYEDTEPDEALAMSAAILAVMEGTRQPADSRQAVLAALCMMCGSITGRPHPRSVRRRLQRTPRGSASRGSAAGPGRAPLGRPLHPLVEAAAGTGEPGALLLPDMLVGASRLLKRPLRRGG